MENLIVVRDKRIENKIAKRGNPYQYWTKDGEFVKPASKSDWVESQNKHYIPVDGEEPVEVENEFNCPKCGRHRVGYPSECKNCGSGYKWD